MAKDSVYSLLHFESAVVVGKSDGKTIISDLQNEAYINPGFVEYNLNKPGISTKEAQVNIYRISKEIKPHQICAVISKNMDDLVLTQSQIVDLVKNFPKEIFKGGFSTLFVMKEADKYYLINAYKYSDLYFYVGRMKSKDTGNFYCHHYIVFPASAFKKC